jgi:hypothetical protein
VKASNEEDIASQQTALEKEARVWQLFDRRVRVLELCGRPALMMPYVKSCDDLNEKQKADLQSAVVSALTVLSDNHILHKEMRWGHLGRVQTEQGMKVVPFDFGNIQENVESAEEALKAMQLALYPRPN